MNTIFTIFFNFFRLGLYSFGGPAAHIGYFRQAFVINKNWLTEEQYGQFVALSQFLPGPGSSQVGFSIGYHKAGLMGAIVAFIGFTAPSVILMLLFSFMASAFTDYSVVGNIIVGLKLFAVVIVADATFGMFQTFCRNKITISLAVATAIIILLTTSIIGQVIALLLASLLGVVLLKPIKIVESETKSSQKASDESSQNLNDTSDNNLLALLNLRPLILFVVIVLMLPFLGYFGLEAKIFSDFFQAGSLVFGGGHVVLPLLDNLLVDSVSKDTFLSGYALAQAVPGPMFTFATYLGAELTPSSPFVGALVATIAVFLPGFILILVVLKNWQQIANRPVINGALVGINAAVVGLLIAALYQPVFVSSVLSAKELSLVIVGYYLLKTIKLPIIIIMSLFCLASITLL